MIDWIKAIPGNVVDFIGPEIIISTIKVVVIFLLLLLTTLLVIWFERRVIADMQARVGPNRWGPFGLLQTLADGIKLFFKEDFRPAAADKWTFALAPVMAMVPSFLAFAVVPLGDHVVVGGHRVDLVLSDLNIGILYFLAVGSLGVYGVVLAGWASGSKYPLIGSVRSTAQMISYEIALGLSLVPIVLVAGSLSTVDVVAAQAGTYDDIVLFGRDLNFVEGFIPHWFIVQQWPAFLIFMIAGIAETNRAPFDLPEAETELVAGFHTEYSGIRFAMFFLGEYVHVVAISAMAVTLFFGGWHGWNPEFPAAIDWLQWIVPIFWFTIKTIAFVYLFVWLRATLPRLRYDRLMWLGWKRLIPGALVWIVVTAVLNSDPEEVPTSARLWVMTAVFAVLLAWVWRGDPRLKALEPWRKKEVGRGTA
jgi:NADH-quinone oxidoreductase subunit H